MPHMTLPEPRPEPRRPRRVPLTPASAAAFATLACLLGLAPPADAQTFPHGFGQSSQHPRYQICVENRGGYVANVWAQARATPGTGGERNPSWQRLSQTNHMPLGQSVCWTFVAPLTRAVRIHAEAFTLLGYNTVCELTLEPARATRVYLRGTTFHGSCGE